MHIHIYVYIHLDKDYNLILVYLIQLYDGSSDSDTLLWNRCSTSTPSTTSSTSDHLYMMFYSDEVTTRPGFNASYIICVYYANIIISVYDFIVYI